MLKTTSMQTLGFAIGIYIFALSTFAKSNRMEKINWKVEGMTCSNCALSVNKVLQNEGMKEISVNPITGEVFFEKEGLNGNTEKAKKNIELLGYSVMEDTNEIPLPNKKFLSTYVQKLWFCLPFTLVLMMGHLGMVFNIHFLHNAYVQLFLCLPVFIVGMNFFGKSAYLSLRSGVPNMNVLIALGATSAFIYSLVGLFTNEPSEKNFFETSASIITIVFFGNWLEQVSIQKTQKAIKELTKTEKVIANMIAYDDAHNENIFQVENTHLKVGDLLLIKTGEQVPVDCKILSGEVEVNEAIITGESVPVFKKKNDILIGGSIIATGTIKTYVTATGDQTVLSSIVSMMKQAQNVKPPIQKLADKISAVFVPVVIAIAVLVLLTNCFLVDTGFQEALMRCIAVLVISCPCAMGLATPAAIAVGLGRGAKEGVLYADTNSMELFKNIKQIVFDKTGTLTNGNFAITNYHCDIDENLFKQIVYSLEKQSNHPIAKSIAEIWKTNTAIKWKKAFELKGLGIEGEDKDGNVYRIGSSKISASIVESKHQLYITQNDKCIGWIDVADELRTEAKEVIRFCKSLGIKTILLSGDTLVKCRYIANELQIDEVFAEQNPQQKLDKLEELVKLLPTVMVGDGINDAPALAKATISISLSKASQLAIQSSSVILMDSGLKKLPLAMSLGKETYKTIRNNLFWAFLYNVIAIPIAAIGLLKPTTAALAMGLSDVVLVANSLWLKWKKLD